MLTSPEVDADAEKLIAEFRKSLAEGSFIKLILSNYKGEDRGLQRVTVRPIITKSGSRLMFQSRFEKRDVVKNFDQAVAATEAKRLLASGFRSAHLFTTVADLQLTVGKRSSRLTTGRPSVGSLPPASHDRRKRTLIDPHAFYLKALGIADDSGGIKPSQQNKWRQINKFVEILAGLLAASPIHDKTDLKIVDMGSGKGYLTFAAYDHLAAKIGADVQMVGVEQRTELVDTCNEVARAGGYDGLRFEQGTIADFDVDGMDILIALHACDTATDDALYKGLAANASIIIASPCCHKEIRNQMKSPEILAAVLKHGVMLERTAETITDGLRALILESEGYKTKLFEFVPTEHTPKNNMLVGTKSKGIRRDRAGFEAKRLMEAFGIGYQRLDQLLHPVGIDGIRERKQGA